jgi:uncharacterized protein DUF6941
MGTPEPAAERDPTLEEPRIDSLMTADWAEAVNGKLYLGGGGFDTVFAPQFPTVVRFFIAGMLVVPWKDTNRRFPLQGSVETADGEPLEWRMDGQVEAGRQPGRKAGDVQIVLAAPVQFEAADAFDFVLKLRFASDERRLSLRVTAPPFQMVGLPQPPEPPS